jgi:hypothetical protein
LLAWFAFRFCGGFAVAETEEPEIAMPAGEDEGYPVINPINGKIYSVRRDQIVVNVMVNPSKRAVFNIPVEGAGGELKGKILAGAMLALVTIAAACVPAIYSAVSAGKSAAETLKEAKSAAVDATPDASTTATETIMDQGSTQDPNSTGNLASGSSGSVQSNPAGQATIQSNPWQSDIDPAVAQATQESYAMGIEPGSITDPSNRLQQDAETKRLIEERDEADRKLAQEQASNNQAERKRENDDRLKAAEKAKADRITLAQSIRDSTAQYLARFDAQRNQPRTVESYPPQQSQSNNIQPNNAQQNAGGGGGGQLPPTDAAQTAASLAALAAQLSAIQDSTNVSSPIAP